ncbi:MAG: bifunctional DNA-formamidopyrimidine glycosylase/DNA-(apurinic or apyrimidinic site) lyase [Patescibacteria group bacterium]
MPELPEIETIKLQLQKVLIGQKLIRVQVLSPKSVQGNIKLLEGQQVEGIRRKAKVLLIDFSKNLTAAFHFKMTGQLVYNGVGGPARNASIRVAGGHPTEDFVGKLPSAHTRVIFDFDHGPPAGRQGALYFNDQRLFGWVIVDTSAKIETLKFLQKLGPEPHVTKSSSGQAFLTLDLFKKILSKSRRPIKVVIMDQEVISGVGNIYANDALWEARINPRTPASQLDSKTSRQLYDAILKVLREGIKYGGATAADAKYVDLRGLGGHYQDHFRVYDRENLPCHNCGTKVEKFVLGGRGTYFCPACQR